MVPRHEVLSAFYFLTNLPIPGSFRRLSGSTGPSPSTDITVARYLDIPKPSAKVSPETADPLLDGGPYRELILRLIATHHKMPKLHDRPPKVDYLKFEGLDSHTTSKLSEVYQLAPLTGLNSTPSASDQATVDKLESLRLANLCALDSMDKSELSKAWLDSPEYLFVLGRLALLLGDHSASAKEVLDLGLVGADEAKKEYLKNQARKLVDEGHILAKSAPVKLADHLDHVYAATEDAFSLLQKPFPSLKAEYLKALPLPGPGRFYWQGAAQQAINDAKLTNEDGFFGVVLSGTGSGKTQGGFRIMGALREGSPRFTLGLSQGSLAVQQGVEYRAKLSVPAEDCAIFVGWRSQELLNAELAKAKALAEKDGNDEALKALEQSDEHFEVQDGSSKVEASSCLAHLSQDARKLIQTPIAVMTIDHIMSALKGVRGHFVPSMLRVATSDLLIDEIDSFSVTDLHPVGRLIYLSGLMGRRVVIESASVTPEIAQGLFEAYRKGYRQYQSIHGGKLYAGWFGDQDGSIAVVEKVSLDDCKVFLETHHQVTQRVRAYLASQVHRRKLALLPIDTRLKVPGLSKENGTSWMYPILEACAAQALIHNTPITSADGKEIKFSTGFIRLNRARSVYDFINRLRGLVAELGKDARFTGWQVKFNVLTSRLDSVARRDLESKLGQLTNRSAASTWYEMPEVKSLKKNTLYLVVSTAIMEVGRDFDFDFGVLEPASDASIIQSAGRVLRHRVDKAPAEPNVHLLSMSLREFSAKYEAIAKGDNLRYGARGAGVEQLPGMFWGDPEKIGGRDRKNAESAKLAFGVEAYSKGIHAGLRVSDSTSLAVPGDASPSPADSLDRSLQRKVLFESDSPKALSAHLDKKTFLHIEDSTLEFRQTDSEDEIHYVPLMRIGGQWFAPKKLEPGKDSNQVQKWEPLKTAGVVNEISGTDYQERFGDFALFDLSEAVIKAAKTRATVQGRSEGGLHRFDYHPFLGAITYWVVD